MRPDGLPFRCAESITCFSQRLRYRTDSLLGVDNDDRKHEQAQGQACRENGTSIGCGRVNQSEYCSAGEWFKSPYEDGESQNSIHNGWHASEIIDVGANSAI